MPRLPLPEDDQPSEQLPTSHASLQRRRSISVPKKQDTPFHSDEHPEVPKVRRASLRLDETPKEAEHDPQVSASLPSTRMRRTARIAMDEPGEESEGHNDLQAAEQIIVSPHRHSAIYEPPLPSHSRSRTSQTRRRTRATQSRRRSTRSMLSVLQDISHNRALMVLGTLLLVFLILLPLTITIITNMVHAHKSLTNGLTSSSAGNQNHNGGVIQPADPYELVIVPTDTDHPPPPVFATSAYLLDADTGITLYAYNPFLHLPMLSTTKLMTALLAIKKGNLDQRVTINNQLAHDIAQLSADSSVMGIKTGETYTLRELLYGMFLVSGNDAAIAVADAISGSVPKFVALMNQTAQQLGLYNTHYMNPHGLLATDHYSSAHDLALLGLDVMNNPTLHAISGTKTYAIAKTPDHPEHLLINGNQFLWWYPGVDGGKPGWDGATNFIQVISCTRNGHHLIGVTMNTKDWWTDMRDLMNWGFNTFSWVSPYDSDIAHPPIPYDYDWNYFVSDKKTNTIPTADHGRYYIYTGFEISGPIMSYFDGNGGLNHFGYPTALPHFTSSTVVQQSFEHANIQCDLVAKHCTTA